MVDRKKVPKIASLCVFEPIDDRELEMNSVDVRLRDPGATRGWNHGQMYGSARRPALNGSIARSAFACANNRSKVRAV